jgi:tRNA1(Val) A37 N6-methylase TrmN6
MSLDHPADFVKPQTVTADAFLGGRLILSQPRNGFRAGLDSVLLGAAVRTETSRILDLGAGVGTAGLVALMHGPNATATLAERDGAVLPLLDANIAGNGLTDRAVALPADVTLSGPARTATGLAPNAFSSVIANPPYFDPGRGSAPSADRQASRHMAGNSLELWLRTAASCAAGGGEAIVVYPAAGLPALLQAFGTRFGAITVLPLLPRPGEAASRVLVRGIKGSRAPFTLLAARALHDGEGRAFRPEFDRIFRGDDRLHW